MRTMILFSGVSEGLNGLFPELSNCVEENIPGRAGRSMLEATKLAKNKASASSTGLSGGFFQELCFR